MKHNKSKLFDHFTWVLFATVFLYGCFEDPNKEANKLLNKTVTIIEQAELETDTNKKQSLYVTAKNNLDQIIEKYPESSVAVQLSTTGEIGKIHIKEIELAANVAVHSNNELEQGTNKVREKTVDFHDLGGLPGGDDSSFPSGISADGSVIVGYSRSSNGLEAFRYTESGGMVGLGDLPGRKFYSEALGVSADGKVIVGVSSSSGKEEMQSHVEAFRYTESEGMVGLGDLTDGTYNVNVGTASSANAVSANGRVVVGQSIGNDFLDAISYTVESGMISLGHLRTDGRYTSSEASDISDDSSVIVGQSVIDEDSDFQPIIEAFRYTKNSGMVGIGDLPGGKFHSSALGISGDGAVIVGHSESASGSEAFRYSQALGMIGLGDIPGGEFSSVAFDVSVDGSIIVGRSNSNNKDEAFIWDEINGMQSLKEILISNGVDLTGWRLIGATAISADGKTIVGQGKLKGKYKGFIARINDVTALISKSIKRQKELTGSQRNLEPNFNSDEKTVTVNDHRLVGAWDSCDLMYGTIGEFEKTSITFDGKRFIMHFGNKYYDVSCSSGGNITDIQKGTYKTGKAFNTPDGGLALEIDFSFESTGSTLFTSYKASNSGKMLIIGGGNGGDSKSQRIINLKKNSLKLYKSR